ncbi:hypothetical protein NBRC10512_000922 [Rhodotorula toruloides]|uniref:RHTO0S06e05776g1_1 n=2 Tax=Rhodotorula toruloides TaxID=5286 RepID=A0A061B264_RHOTO|nr:UPF0405 domain protein [Rhodotorula toruloides NP11]EMS24241.1 UPF0405 domain protein [Rhodotorula toruloides NP11]CDR41762.1 RHTO0S06e05776g1_1 [Rhodotorula toruloides]
MNRIADPLSFTYAPTSASSPNSFISSSSLPPDSSLLVTDTLDSPAHFLLLQLVSNALRPSGAGRGALRELDERRRVVILGVKEREEYWASLLKKSGVQLATERSKGSFVFLDCSSPTETPSSLLSVAASALAPPDQAADESSRSNPHLGPLIVLDDVCTLSWMGMAMREVLRFWAALRRLTSEHSASLVTLFHADSLSPSPSFPSPAAPAYDSPEDQYLFRSLLQRSDLWVEVTGLSSAGMGGQGEITIHRGPSLISPHPSASPAARPSFGNWTVDAPRIGPTAVQYKMEEAGAVYQVKGGGTLGRAW